MDKLHASKKVLKPTKMHKKVSWSDASKQFFSFPSSIIYIIAKNPSTPEVYSKLIKTCKYFFEKNPILIVKRIHDGGRKLCSNDECQENFDKCCIRIDIKKLSSKLWITTRLTLANNLVQSASLLLFFSKIYKCRNAKLIIRRYKMTLNEFKLLASKFKRFQLRDVAIVDDNGNTVMLENILESIPVVFDFDYRFDGIPAATISTVKNISKLQNIGKLFCLLDIPQVFVVKDFENFIMPNKNTHFWFEFHENISDDYKKQLDDLINRVIATDVHHCVIYHHEMDIKRYDIMRKRYR